MLNKMGGVNRNSLLCFTDDPAKSFTKTCDKGSLSLAPKREENLSCHISQSMIKAVFQNKHKNINGHVKKNVTKSFQSILKITEL